MISRRSFLETCATGAAGLAVSASARSYAQILGANDRVNFAVIGLHGRGNAHLSALRANRQSARITHVCDVDSVILSKSAAKAERALGYAPSAVKDFRTLLESKDVDAITIATPDHWHTSMAIDGLKAGKSVYVEKPCSYDPYEGELLVAAQRKYARPVQMGTQQRSSPHTIEIVSKIHDGLIGRPYFAKAWYASNRKSIGIGKVAAVPASLDWNLWQGPAPRRVYKGNIQPYNWHWFRLYGTGEALNNGTHEVDVCRWALGVDLPNAVSASGGRYQFKDDWQFYDTLITNFNYADRMISWEGRSCQPMQIYGRDRGSLILGTNGSVLVDRGGYEVYDESNYMIDEFKVAGGTKTVSSNLTREDTMTNAHFANFIAAIQRGENLNSPVAVGNVAVTMLQLSNIAWEVGRELKLDPATGRILGDAPAQRMTRRDYEKGWDIRI